MWTRINTSLRKKDKDLTQSVHLKSRYTNPAGKKERKAASSKADKYGQELQMNDVNVFKARKFRAMPEAADTEEEFVQKCRRCQMRPAEKRSKK